VERQVV